MPGSGLSYRGRNYILGDIILKLVEYGELNKTNLIGSCGLNLKKHRCILDELQVNGLIQVIQSSVGKRTIATYKPTQKGIEFCRTILEPYEKIFPRTIQRNIIANNSDDKEKLLIIGMRKSLIEHHLTGSEKSYPVEVKQS